MVIWSAPSQAIMRLEGLFFYSCAEREEAAWELNFLSNQHQMLSSDQQARARKSNPVHSFNHHSSFRSLLSYFHTPFDPPPFRHSSSKHHRCPQAAHWGPLPDAWRVCHACGAGTREGKEVTHRFQQDGGPECGDPGGGRQEDAGETWQRQRHHLCPHCHEHGEDNVSFPGTSSAQQRCCTAELNWWRNILLLMRICYPCHNLAQK